MNSPGWQLKENFSHQDGSFSCIGDCIGHNFEPCDKVVSGILSHRTLLTDERGGREQTNDDFKIASKCPSLDPQ